MKPNQALCAVQEHIGNAMQSLDSISNNNDPDQSLAIYNIIQKLCDILEQVKQLTLES